MAKKKVADKIAGEDTVSQEVIDEAAKVVAKARSRGPKGVAEDAVITVLADANPKREGSKAQAAFANYVTGMTVKEFADLVGKEATGHLVYDAKHGFISIDGYDPGAIVTPKPKAPKAPKKPKKEKTAEAEQAEVEAQAEATAEQME